MKILTLNTWGGRAGRDKLLDFFRRHAGDTDVFCLQEVWSAPYENYDGHAAGGRSIDHAQIMTEGMQDISALLSDYTPHFRPHFMDNYGLMMLVKNNQDVLAEGEVFVYKEKGYIPDGDIGRHARNIQYVTLRVNNAPLTIINFHGLWNGNGKTDSAERIQQSKNILKFVESLSGECVICGDFNLLPDTESMTLFEEHGFQNLVKEHGVTSTRSSFYDKPEKHADYILVSRGLEEKDFAVLPDEVSDHLPLYVDVTQI